MQLALHSTKTARKMDHDVEVDEDGAHATDVVETTEKASRTRTASPKPPLGTRSAPTTPLIAFCVCVAG